MDPVAPAEDVQRPDPWTALGLALLVAAAVTALSWLTAIVEGSPIHSDSWGPTLLVWLAGPCAGVLLLLTGRRIAAAACVLGAVLGVIGFVLTVILYVATHGT